MMYVIGATRHTSLSCPRAWTAACDWTLQATAKVKDAHPREIEYIWIWCEVIAYTLAIHSAISVSIGRTLTWAKQVRQTPLWLLTVLFWVATLRFFHVWVRHKEIVRSLTRAQLDIDNIWIIKIYKLQTKWSKTYPLHWSPVSVSAHAFLGQKIKQLEQKWGSEVKALKQDLFWDGYFRYFEIYFHVWLRIGLDWTRPNHPKVLSWLSLLRRIYIERFWRTTTIRTWCDTIVMLLMRSLVQGKRCSFAVSMRLSYCTWDTVLYYIKKY